MGMLDSEQIDETWAYVLAVLVYTFLAGYAAIIVVYRSKEMGQKLIQTVKRRKTQAKEKENKGVEMAGRGDGVEEDFYGINGDDGDGGGDGSQDQKQEFGDPFATFLDTHDQENV